jgi:hypothetical protein
MDMEDWYPDWEQREAERLANLVRASQRHQDSVARAAQARRAGWVPVDEVFSAADPEPPYRPYAYRGAYPGPKCTSPLAWWPGRPRVTYDSDPDMKQPGPT